MTAALALAPYGSTVLHPGDPSKTLFCFAFYFRATEIRLLLHSL